MSKRVRAIQKWQGCRIADCLLVVLLSFVLPTASRASVNTVQFSTSPALTPAFTPSVSDYVVRLTSGTQVVQVNVSNTDGTDTTTTVSVDGQTPTVGAFSAQVSLDQGQGIKISAVQGGTSRDYYVRSLPNGFPTWGSQRLGSPQAEYYVVVPVPSTGVGIAKRYITIYDTNGVPIWWTRPVNPLRPVDAKLTSNSEILWTESQTSSAVQGLKAEHRRLDDSIIDDDIRPVGYQLDAHEVQHLDNGNYLVIGTYGKPGYNLSSLGFPANASILDSVIQEVTTNGTALWTWLASDHIGIDEVEEQWTSTIGQYSSAYDVFHLNSAVKDSPGNLLIGFRYLNAVYKITNPGGLTNPGKIIWKLGGSVPTVEPGTRLTISGDPVFNSGGGFGGQHYPRYFDAGDGNLYVTLYDNSGGESHNPRGVMYRINEQTMTATFIENVMDSLINNSPCCGSAAKLPTGNWVISWGQNTTMTESATNGARVFVLC